VETSLISFDTIAVLNRIEDELPELIGSEGWTVVGDRIQAKMKQLRVCTDPTEQALLSVELIGLLNPYDQANKRYNVEFEIQEDLQQQMHHNVTALLADLKTSDKQLTSSAYALTYILQGTINPTDLPTPQEIAKRRELRNRGIKIPRSGVGGGKSIKFQNMHLDFGEMAEIAAGAMLAGFQVIEKPHPLMIAAGVLLTIKAVTKAMTVQLTEQEASLFWGFIQVRDEDNTASKDAIFEKTNSERKINEQKPLTKAELERSLRALSDLKSIEPIEDSRWRLIESYSIRD